MERKNKELLTEVLPVRDGTLMIDDATESYDDQMLEDQEFIKQNFFIGDHDYE